MCEEAGEPGCVETGISWWAELRAGLDASLSCKSVCACISWWYVMPSGWRLWLFAGLHL